MNRSFKTVVAYSVTLAGAWWLASCSAPLSPEKICAAPDTISNVEELLNSTVAKGGDDRFKPDALAAALQTLWRGGVIKLDLLTLKSVDHDTKKIGCSGQIEIKLSEQQQQAMLKLTGGDNPLGAVAAELALGGVGIDKVEDAFNDGQASLPISFDRQPSADGKSYVFTYERSEKLESSLRVSAALQTLVEPAGKTPAPVAPVASASPPAAPATNPDDAILEARDTPDYHKCMSSGAAADGVTSAMLDCTAAETKAQDAKLNATYQKVMAGLDDAGKAKLRDAERAWIKFRDSKCDSENQTGGTMDAINGSGCILSAIIHRTIELEGMASSN